MIEPIFETGFCEGSSVYPGQVGSPTRAGGFRPGRGCHDALREVDRWLEAGYTHVVDADLASYFDTIPHDALMARVEAKVSDGRLLDPIRSWLKADILRGMERWTPVRGSPQGAVISPLLANIYLDPLDRLLARHGYRMVRYADDFRHPVPQPCGGHSGSRVGCGMGERERSAAAPRQDADRELPQEGERL